MKDIFYNRQTSLYGRTSCIAFGFLAMVLWTMIIVTFYNYIDPPTKSGFSFDTPETLGHRIFFGCISAPLWEEIVFRWFPLYTTRKLSMDYKIPIVLATSAIFGFVHGGPQNVWMQGVSGLIIACVYIKTDYNYWSAVVLHFLWNFMCLFGFSFLSN